MMWFFKRLDSNIRNEFLVRSFELIAVVALSVALTIQVFGGSKSSDNGPQNEKTYEILTIKGK